MGDLLIDDNPGHSPELERVSNPTPPLACWLLCRKPRRQHLRSKADYAVSP